MMSQPFGAFQPNAGTDRPLRCPADGAVELLRRVHRCAARPAAAGTAEDPAGRRSAARDRRLRRTRAGRATWTSPGAARAVRAGDYHFAGLFVNGDSGRACAHARLLQQRRGCAVDDDGACVRASARRCSTRTSRRRPIRCRRTGPVGIACRPTPACRRARRAASPSFHCDGKAGVIDVCAEACTWGTTDVSLNPQGLSFGICRRRRTDFHGHDDRVRGSERQTAPPSGSSISPAGASPRCSTALPKPVCSRFAGMVATTSGSQAAVRHVFVKLHDGAKQASRKVVVGR